jgi:hypothetical protein
MRASRPAIVTTLLACALHLATPATSAFAQAGATLVAIVTSEPNAPVVRQVEEQLQGLGLDVLVLNPPAERFEQAARNAGAVAAVRLDPVSQNVQVWVADRVTGKAVVNEKTAPQGVKLSDASLALGAVELLRASLIELHPAETLRPEAVAPPVPAPPVPPACPEKPAPVERASNPRLGVSLGTGLDFASAWQPAPVVDAAAWFSVVPRVNVRLIASLTAAPAQVDAHQEGHVDVSSQLYGVLAAFDLVDPARELVPMLGVGVGAAWVAAGGEISTPMYKPSYSTYPGPVGIPLVEAGLSWAFVHALRLRADVLGGWALGRVGIHDAQGEIARWGAPLVKGSIALEVPWTVK